MDKDHSEHLQSLITALDDIIFEIDGNTTFKNVWVSDESILFMPKEQFLGRQIPDVMGPLTEMLVDGINRTIEAGKPQELMYPHIDPNVNKWYKATIRPVVQSAIPEQYTLVLSVKDITEQKRIEDDNIEKTRLLGGLLDNLPIIIFKLLNNGTIISSAGAGLNELHIDVKDLIGRNAFKLFSTAARDLQKATKENRNRFITSVTNDGDQRYFDCIIFSSIENGQEGILGFAIDITQSQLSEKEIQRQSEYLADLNKFKDKILAIISHDIRNPLNTLTGLLSIPGIFSTMDEDSEARNMLIERLNTVNTMVNGLLNWAASSFRETENRIETISVDEIIKQNITLLEAAANQKGVHMINNVVSATLISGNYDEINIVVRNLLNNAIKFTPSNGDVIIASALQNNYVIISVRDTGVGMTASQLEKLFTPSLEATHGTNKEKGTGIGLLVCKEYIERNGGEISVWSEPGKGSTFELKMRMPKEVVG